jgi:outer membrane protein assembly factor BamB
MTRVALGRGLSVASSVLVSLGLAQALLAADWPQWRGPNRDGVSKETGLLRSWDEEGPPQVWKTTGLGGGYSSVVIAKGKIFTMGSQRGGTAISALDTDGKLLWTTRIGGGGEPNCTPTYDDGLVYGVSKNGDLACVDAETGELKWEKNFSKDFGGRMMSGWGYSESPLVDGERLLCTPGSKDAAIAALDKKTGRVIWKSAVPDGAGGAGYSSIVVAQVGGIRQYVQLMGRGLIGVAAKDGKLLWNYTKIANGTANIPTPIVKDNFVFCSSGYGTGSALLRLTASGGRVRADQVYFLPGDKVQNHHGGMVMLGDYVYFGEGHNNGFPICVNWKTGKVAWSKGRGPGSGSAAITCADGHLYFRYENGLMALIEATPGSYKEKGTFKIPEPRQQSWSHPVVSDGKLYLRSQDQLICFDVRKKDVAGASSRRASDE